MIFVAPGQSDFQLYGTILDREPRQAYPVIESEEATLYPAWSPDGLSIAYLSVNRQSEKATLHVYDLLEKISRPLSSQAVNFTENLCWTHDSQYLVWSGPQPNGAERDVYRMEVATGKITNLTASSPVWDAFPACSPVSAEIAFTSDRAVEGNKDTDQIWVMDIEGKNLRPITVSPGLENTNPSWSPDGSEITFYRGGLFDAEGSPKGLLAARADGSTERLVVGYEIIFTAGFSAPAWSPDGQWIAYNTGLAPETDVSIVPSQGGEPAVVSSLDGRDFDYSWSSRSSYLLFTNDREEKFLVFLAQVGGGVPEPLFPEEISFMARFGPDVTRQP